MQGYCVRCRQKRDLKDCKIIQTKNGKEATSGLCCECGCKVIVFSKKGAEPKTEAETQPEPEPKAKKTKSKV
jgi:hypothetical protein